MERTSFTVTELNAHIKQLLDADMLLGNVCVTGELSNYKVYPDTTTSHSRMPRAACAA